MRWSEKQTFANAAVLGAISACKLVTAPTSACVQKNCMVCRVMPAYLPLADNICKKIDAIWWASYFLVSPFYFSVFSFDYYFSFLKFWLHLTHRPAPGFRTRRGDR